MAKKTATRTDGNLSLEAAMALLIQNQAQWVRDMAHIRKDFEEVMRILIRHERLLTSLAEAVRKKIGFKQ